MRNATQKEYSHDRLGDRFEHALSNYDTERRVEVLVDDFLTEAMVKGKRTLEVGCGLGFFSQQLMDRGADLLATDLGPNLVERTKARVGCAGEVADTLRLVDQFGENSFDLVLSSECIEHTPDPDLALAEMAKVLKPGGYLSVSTPNLIWQPVVRMASRLKLRAFDGHENFSTLSSMTRALEGNGMRVVRVEGLHLYPFQFKVHALSRWLDRNFQIFRPLMINICILAQKQGQEN